MVELSLVVGKSRREKKIPQSATWKVETGYQEEEGSLLCHSKGTAVVQEVTQKECGSATALCLKEQPVRVETHQ